jgi:hypothetical protein
MKKIAFCFLIYDEIAHEELWNEFFKSAPEGSYSIYVHYKENNPLKFFEQYKLKECIPTSHGHVSLIHAYNRLFQEAYKDEDNSKFCIVSGSCIPLKSFDYIYDFLTKDDNAYFFNNTNNNSCFPRCDSLLEFYPKDKIKKSSNWFILNRNITENICFKSKDEIDKIYNKVSSPEEHYYITEIYDKNLQYQVNFLETTFANWGNKSYKYGKDVICKNSPKTYLEITKEEYESRISTLKEINLDNVMELDDNIDFGQISACSGSQCEINI